MGPRAPRPSNLLKRCQIVVIGSLGKDVKYTDIEKWVVNNGGTFKKSIDSNTTHVLCTFDTFRKDDFALSKPYCNSKKPYFVPWDWLEDTLMSKRVKPAAKYSHKRLLDSTTEKKQARRTALLTGKDVKDIEREEAKKIAEEMKATESKKRKFYDEDEDSKGQAQTHRQRTIPEEKPEVVFEVYKDPKGVVWSVELAEDDGDDDGDDRYILKIETAVNAENPYYKVGYTYVSGGEEMNIHIWGGQSFEDVEAHFKGFYKNKTVAGDWDAYYESLLHSFEEAAKKKEEEGFDKEQQQEQQQQQTYAAELEFDAKLMERYQDKSRLEDTNRYDELIRWNPVNLHSPGREFTPAPAVGENSALDESRMIMLAEGEQ